MVSVVGTWMQIIAQGWLVYELSRSEFALGMVSFASAIPNLIASPWGGVMADLLPKRTLLIITQVAAMILALVLAALTFSGTVQVWHIMVLAALTGVINAFDAPARQTFVVELVGREDLTNAISLNAMMFNSARVIGPAVGGLILAAVGAGWCFLLNGLSFMAVIISLLMIQTTKQSLPKRVHNPWKPFIEGLQYAMQREIVWGMIVLMLLISVFGMSYSALLPAFVDKNLNLDAAAYGVINAVIGIGAVVGALTLARFGNSDIRGRLLFGASMVYPVALLCFAFNPFYAGALVLALILGLCFMLIANNVNSLLQLNVDDAVRGRVMGLFTLTFFGLSPFGALAAGAIAERISMTWTIGGAALILAASSWLIFWRIPKIRMLK